MSKNKSQSTVTTTSTSLYISLICLFPVMFLISYLIFYMIDTMLLKLDVSFVDSFLNHKRDGAITGICMFLDTSMYLCCQIYLYEFRYNHSTFVDLLDCCRDKEKGLVT